MKLIQTTERKDGTTRVIAVLNPGEKLIVVRDNAHYRLGPPMDDIVPAHVIEEAHPVVWCCVSQEWVGV
jgi:hypothetical protein